MLVSHIICLCLYIKYCNFDFRCIVDFFNLRPDNGMVGRLMLAIADV